MRNFENEMTQEEKNEIKKAFAEYNDKLTELNLSKQKLKELIEPFIDELAYQYDFTKEEHNEFKNNYALEVYKIDFKF